jgi:hypothetical protein
LHPGDRVGNFRRKDSVDFAAIIAEPAKIPLHRAHISRIVNQGFPGIVIVVISAAGARLEIRLIQKRRLVQPPVLVPSRQRIIGIEKPVEKNFPSNWGFRPPNTAAEQKMKTAKRSKQMFGS